MWKHFGCNFQSEPQSENLQEVQVRHVKDLAKDIPLNWLTGFLGAQILGWTGTK